jgi:hypothetical protein
VPLTDDEIDLIDKMLTLDPKERLGSPSILELKKHPYFDGMDFIKIS